MPASQAAAVLFHFYCYPPRLPARTLICACSTAIFFPTGRQPRQRLLTIVHLFESMTLLLSEMLLLGSHNPCKPGDRQRRGGGGGGRQFGGGVGESCSGALQSGQEATGQRIPKMPALGQFMSPPAWHTKGLCTTPDRQGSGARHVPHAQSGKNGCPPVPPACPVGREMEFGVAERTERRSWRANCLKRPRGTPHALPALQQPPAMN